MVILFITVFVEPPSKLKSFVFVKYDSKLIEIVSISMANGVIERGDADISVSVTGIAGPSGGSIEKPVGLVHISTARKNYKPLHERHLFDGDRDAIRLQTVETALALLLKQAET